MRHEPRASEALLRSLRLTTALTAVPHPADDKTVPIRAAGPGAAADRAPAPPAEPPEQAAPGQALEQASPPAPEQAPEQAPGPAASPRARPRPPGRRPVRRRHGRPRAADRRVAAARPPAAARGRLAAPPLVFMFSPLAVGLCYLALRQQPARWPGFRAEPPEQGRRPLVGGRGHRRGRGRLRGLADRRADPAGHRPRRPGHLPADRLLDRAPRLAAHPVLTRGLRRHAPRPDLRQRRLLPVRVGPVPGRHGRNPPGPGRRDLARRRPGRAGHHPADRRVRGAVVRRAGRAGRRPVGARRGRRPRAEPARAVHQPRHVQRAAGPGPAVRRPVPAD